MLTGCGSISPNKLQPTDSTKALRLKDSFSYEAFFKLSGIRYRLSLIQGRYVANGQDESGVYYLGPDECFHVVMTEAGWGGADSLVGKTVLASDCGIYVFTDPRKEPQVFIVNGSNYRYSKSVAAASAPQLDTATTQSIVTPAAQSASPIQAGVGGALGAGIVEAIIAAERGNYGLYRDQPLGPGLRLALIAEKAGQ